MNFEKALRILGLNSNFTEEELKKAHRVLVNKYHPDRNKSPEAENKMKEINEAREYLVKYSRMFQNHYTRNTTQSSANNSREAEMYYQEKLDELSNIAKFDFNKYKVSNKIKVVLDAIKQIVHYYSIYAKNKKEKEIVHQEYEEYLKMIKYRFKELTAKFYEENGIDKKNVKETINYDCTLEELYEQLLKISDKYGKEPIIKKLLEKEIEKYKTYAGYDEISDRIEDCTNDTFNKIKNNGFNYTQKDIDDMHIEIEQIFKTYYILIKKIKELESIVNTIENQEIKNYYKVIERNFYGGIPYSEFDEHIKELEEMIDKHNKENQKKIDFKKNEQQINQIYQSLITRYSQETKQYDVIKEQSLINTQLTFLKELLELYCKGCIEFKDLDYFNLFNEITFTNVENDNKIKEIIIKNSKQNNSRTTKSKIYIRVKENTLVESEYFYYLDEEKHQIYQVCYSFSHNYCYEKQCYELGDKYISLEEFLDKATFIGENKVDINMNIYAVIYEMDDYLLCIKDDKFCIQYRKPLYKTSDKRYIHLDVYKDKNYLIELIKKQIEQTIEEEKKKETRNPQSTKHKKYTSYIRHDKNEEKNYKKIIYTSQSDETSHMDDKFYESVFGEKQFNTDDSYGYNNSGRRKR